MEHKNLWSTTMKSRFGLVLKSLDFRILGPSRAENKKENSVLEKRRCGDSKSNLEPNPKQHQNQKTKTKLWGESLVSAWKIVFLVFIEFFVFLVSFIKKQKKHKVFVGVCFGLCNLESQKNKKTQGFCLFFAYVYWKNKRRLKTYVFLFWALVIV